MANPLALENKLISKHWNSFSSVFFNLYPKIPVFPYTQKKTFFNGNEKKKLTLTQGLDALHYSTLRNQWSSKFGQKKIIFKK